uniref:Coat protein n=1 Tax=Erysiphales associated totivirus 1 TaxID=2719839 RepID=A0A6G9ELN7_9VIRU|nr:coat protein [Erysiphales associated totivirus 1]
MAFQMFDQLTGVLAEMMPVEGLLKKEVRYGIKANLKYDVSTQNSAQFTRTGAQFTNVLTANGLITADVVKDIQMSDGFNASMLDGAGFLEGGRIGDALILSGFFRSNIGRMMGPMIAANSYDNVVGVLVNLLRVWILYDNDMGALKITNGTKLYDDGHVSVNAKDYYKTDIPDAFDMQFSNDVGVNVFNENTAIVPNMFCPNVSNLTAREVGILVKLCGTISCRYPVRLAFSSPRLTNMIYLQPGIAHEMAISISNFSSVEVLNILYKFVVANRVEAQFDIAYHMIVTSMYKPVARCVETNGWLSPVDMISLPQAESVRGVAAEITSGRPYTPRPDAVLTWSNFQRNTRRIYVHAIAVCEAMYTGIFEILTSTNIDNCDRWQIVGIHGVSDAVPYRVINECLAFRLGKSFETPWRTRVGLNFYSHLLSHSPAQQQIPVDVVGDATGYDIYEREVNTIKTKFIRAKSMRPALVPILTIGIKDNKYFTNFINFEGSLEYDSVDRTLFTTSGTDMSKMMLAMRMGGYNMKVYDVKTGRSYLNWAANSDGHSMPEIRPGGIGSGMYVCPVDGIQKRKHSWINFDNVTQRLRIKIGMDVKGYVVYANGQPMYTYNAQYIPVTKVSPTVTADDVNIFMQRVGVLPDDYSYCYSDFILASANKQEDPMFAPSVPMGYGMLRSMEIAMAGAAFNMAELEEWQATRDIDAE